MKKSCFILLMASMIVMQSGVLTLAETTPDVCEEVEASCVSEEDAEDEKDTIIYVEPVIQRFLNQVETYEFVTDAEESEYASQVVFTVSEPIQELRYFSLVPDFSEDGEILITEKKELLALNSFEPGQFLVAELEFLEFMPTHGIEFKDQKDILHCYLLSESGLDGMPVLSEYDAYSTSEDDNLMSDTQKLPFIK